MWIYHTMQNWLWITFLIFVIVSSAPFYKVGNILPSPMVWSYRLFDLVDCEYLLLDLFYFWGLVLARLLPYFPCGSRLSLRSVFEPLHPAFLSLFLSWNHRTIELFLSSLWLILIEFYQFWAHWRGVIKNYRHHFSFNLKSRFIYISGSVHQFFCILAV